MQKEGGEKIQFFSSTRRFLPNKFAVRGLLVGYERTNGYECDARLRFLGILQCVMPIDTIERG